MALTNVANCAFVDRGGVHAESGSASLDRDCRGEVRIALTG